MIKNSSKKVCKRPIDCIGSILSSLQRDFFEENDRFSEVDMSLKTTCQSHLIVETILNAEIFINLKNSENSKTDVIDNKGN